MERKSNPLLIAWLLQDGKAGHQNQALALIEALKLQVSLIVYPIKVEASSVPGLSLLQALFRSRNLPRPNLLVGAGHCTHVALLALAWLHCARSLVLMRPSLPLWVFSRVVAPSHDFCALETSSNLITTFGPLCRQPSEAMEVFQKDVASHFPSTLVLLGGPSRHHGFDLAALRIKLRALYASHGSSDGLCLVESRRTPPGIIQSFGDELGLASEQLRHWQLCPPGWLAAALACRPEVWVTEDSMSMIFEAVTAGCRVVLLPMPRKGRSSRLQVSIDRLLAEGYVYSCDSYGIREELGRFPSRLAEASRVASLLSPWLQGFESGNANAIRSV